MRQSEESVYREGVVLDRPLKQNSKSGSYVDCGLGKVYMHAHMHTHTHTHIHTCTHAHTHMHAHAYCM